MDLLVPSHLRHRDYRGLNQGCEGFALDRCLLHPEHVLQCRNLLDAGIDPLRCVVLWLDGCNNALESGQKLALKKEPKGLLNNHPVSGEKSSDHRYLSRIQMFGVAQERAAEIHLYSIQSPLSHLRYVGYRRSLDRGASYMCLIEVVTGLNASGSGMQQLMGSMRDNPPVTGAVSFPTRLHSARGTN